MNYKVYTCVMHYVKKYSTDGSTVPFVSIWMGTCITNINICEPIFKRWSSCHP